MKNPADAIYQPPSEAGVFSNYFVVRHKDLNHAGTLFGGTMMAWADELAYVAASLSYPGCDFVTKVFETFDFIRGPASGDIVRIDARVVSKGKTSVRVQVSGTWTQSGQPIFSTYAIMVNARNGRAIPIPSVGGMAT